MLERHNYLFWVTTIGQARNAIAIVQTKKIENPEEESIVFVLWSTLNIKLKDRIVSLLLANDIAHEEFELPLRANMRLPWKMRRIYNKYCNVLSQYDPEEIWVTNRNSHYSMLICEAKKRNISVNLFEEGLSTYYQQHTWEKEALLLHQLPKVLRLRAYQAILYHGKKTLLGAIIAFIIKEISAWYALVRSLIGSIFLTLFEAKISKYFWSNAEGVKHFGQTQEQFDKALVVFPENIGFANISANEVQKLDLKFLYETRKQEDHWDFSELPDCMFVSQPYGDRGLIYYSAVAKILDEAGYKDLLVKFHPRESKKERDIFSNLLASRNIECTNVVFLDDLPAEQIIFYGHVKKVVGVVSTTLLYAREFKEDIKVDSLSHRIAKILAHEIETDQRFYKLGYDIEQFNKWGI